jgi:3-hydroxyacyl-[acyl-carrier-protein] dehydratase
MQQKKPKPAEPISLDVNQIQEYLPHRPPFLLIDRVVSTDLVNYVDAIKNVTINEPFFTGHFPGAPVMPGVLILEAMAQAAAIIVMANLAYEGKIPFFISIDGCKFRRPVVPGDQVHIRIDLIIMRATSGRCKAKATVDGAVVTEATLAFVAADPPKKRDT